MNLLTSGAGSGTVGERRKILVMVAVVNGLGHVVSSVQSKCTVGTEEREAGGGVRRVAARIGWWVDWRRVIRALPSLPVEPVMRIVMVGGRGLNVRWDFDDRGKAAKQGIMRRQGNLLCGLPWFWDLPGSFI